MLKTVVYLYRFLFARECFYQVNKLLYRCSLSGLGVLNYENDKVSGEHAFLKKYFESHKGSIVVDVGANVGNYTQRVLQAEPEARIFAFEPHPMTYKRLCENIKDLSGVFVLNAAVGERKGTLTLYDYREEDGSSHASLYKDVIENIHKSESVSHDVNVICLDEFFEENHIEYVSLLKIDTEGHELAVLRGAKSYIDAGKVAAIHFEFNEMNVASRTYFRDFWDLLHNYDFYRLLPAGRIKIQHYNPLFCETFAYQNIIAILRDNKHDQVS